MCVDSIEPTKCLQTLKVLSNLTPHVIRNHIVVSSLRYNYPPPPTPSTQLEVLFENIMFFGDSVKGLL